MALPSGTVWPWSSTSLRDVAPDVRRGRLEAQELLDGVRDERAVLDQLAALVGVLGQHLAGPADQPGGGLVAGAGHDVDVGEHLVAAQAPDGAGLVLELGVEQLGHDVVGRVLGPPVDVLGELLAAGEALRHLHRLARLGAQVARRRGRGSPPGPPRGCRAACRSPASASGRRGRRRSRSRPVPTSGSRLVGAELADLRLERGDLPRREHPRQQAAVDGVGRRVLEDDDARRHLDAGLDQLEDPAAAGDERVAVDAGRARRPRSGSRRRSRAARCSRAAPPPAAGGTPGTGRRRSRRRTGRSRRRSRCIAVTGSSRPSVGTFRARTMTDT